jgi:SpoVK/Ycf46/Vps4 family AAA+-type ATPase
MRNNNLVEETAENILAGIPAVHVVASNYLEVDSFAVNLAKKLNFDIEYEWNFGFGCINFNDKEITEDADFCQVLKTTMRDSVCADKKIFLIKNARFAFEGENNRKNLAVLQQTILHLKEFNNANSAILYADTTRFVPEEIANLVYYVELKNPSKIEITEKVKKALSKENLPPLKKNQIEEIGTVCLGMDNFTIDIIISRALLNKSDFYKKAIEIAHDTKKQFINKSGLLTYVAADENIKSIGGLDNLKYWLEKKKDTIANPQAALDVGIIPARGILLVGIPGCGKSLSAKATANLFGWPLLRLDIGSLMGKYVGDSENNMRRALAIAESASPCVLWVDELEKAFSGISGDGTGITARLFGFFLTWLQEKKAPVFVVATANNIKDIKPELLRRGRFDEIFFVTFPDHNERKHIFKIHLDKLKIKKTEFIDITTLAAETKGYAGSDIEALVNNAAAFALNNDVELSYEIINRHRNYMTPLQIILGESFKDYEKFFKENGIKPASRNKKNSEELDDKIENKDEAKRKEAALDIYINVDGLEKLSRDSKVSVREAVLHNPNCPDNIIDRLTQDKDEEIRKIATQKQKNRRQEITSTKKTVENANVQQLEQETCDNCGLRTPGGTGFICPIGGENPKLPANSCKSWKEK